MPRHLAEGRPFTLLRSIVALSSPSTSSGVSSDREKMPGLAAGTMRGNDWHVSVAISSDIAGAPSRPFWTMHCFRPAPFRYTW